MLYEVITRMATVEGLPGAQPGRAQATAKVEHAEDGAVGINDLPAAVDDQQRLGEEIEQLPSYNFV